jgi:16S rRNA (adenine1518-N6/adenine1519-N6)-dimethyltransferase
MRHVARKRFGQNFLVDDQVIRRIIDAIDPQPDDAIIEIGPGLGALTRPLAARVKHLHAVELDRDIVARLQHEFPAERVSLHSSDALTYDFAVHGTDLRLVGNLPYNISTPLLFRLAQFAPRLRDLHVMLQKEVAQRLVARPDTSEYGRLSVMAQYRFAIDQLIDVPAEAFRPAPQVESVFLRLTPLRSRALEAFDETTLGRVVLAAFSQRRKTLRNTLKGVISPDGLRALGIDPGARAQELALADFVRLANHLDACAQQANSAAPTQVQRRR